MGVTQLAYIGVEISDVPAWRDLLTSVFGLEEREYKGANAPLYYRIDDRHHRIALYPGKSDGLFYAGWEVATMDELRRLADHLNSIGVATAPGSKEEADSRKVLEFFKFRDPDGRAMEISYGPIIDHTPLRPGRPVSGFNAGRLGLGHLVFACKDHYKTAEFYSRELGFRISDYIAWDIADAVFMHCNPRHHSLALMNAVYGMKPGDLNHFMLEAASMDDVGRAYDLVLERKIPLVLTLGRHTNDHMTSFYIKTPSGFAIEYGYGAQLIEDESKWQIRKYNSTKLWGHLLALEEPMM
ncbi:MAG: VOC family protein [Candidatus Binataceae bacterium]